MKKTLLINIEDGGADGGLDGPGWGVDDEAADYIKPLMKGLAETTIKEHKPHLHKKQAIQQRVRS